MAPFLLALRFFDYLICSVFESPATFEVHIYDKYQGFKFDVLFFSFYCKNRYCVLQFAEEKWD
jgi:hypothetical protein